MRILSVGFPLPGVTIENYSFFSAPSFFDYDAIIVDPGTLTGLIEDVVSERVEHRLFGLYEVVNRPATNGRVSLQEALHTRADETAWLLSRGGLVVCLCLPNAVYDTVEGETRLDRYSWLPAPEGMVYDPPLLRAATGNRFGDIVTDHPFGAMLAKVKSRLTYRAYFELSEDDGSQAVATSAGGAVIAADLAVHGGRVVFIPPPTRALDSSGRYQMSEAVQQAIRDFLRLQSESAAPSWAEAYPVGDLDQRLDLERAAKAQHAAAGEEVLRANEAVEELRSIQRMLWEEGRALDEAVRAALKQLGLRIVETSATNSTQAVWGHEGRRGTVHLETAGSEDAVGLEAHHRMRRNIESGFARPPVRRGVLVVNGFRRMDPAERREQYTVELRTAAEHSGYCIVTTSQLFDALRASYADDTAIVERFVQMLFTPDVVSPQE